MQKIMARLNDRPSEVPGHNKLETGSYYLFSPCAGAVHKNQCSAGQKLDEGHPCADALVTNPVRVIVAATRWSLLL